MPEHRCPPAFRDPAPRDVFNALADGAAALRHLAQEVAYDANRFLNQGDRDRVATNAYARYERQRAHALLLDQLADELQLVNIHARLGQTAGALHSLTPDEAHT